MKLRPPDNWPKIAKKLDTTYKNARFGNCTYALILDKRHPKKDKNTFSVVMRYTIDRKSWYNFVAGEFTEEDFAKVCNLSVKAVRSELYEKKRNLMPSLRRKWS
ncbi:hypothetical protein [Prevotella corporis]|uniref:hypothetical protein n=2 Tax=Bacteroidales TaxID=171549 RepID=UPI0018D2544B|nr:hypothetical protein [Prevotella corporis]